MKNARQLRQERAELHQRMTELDEEIGEGIWTDDQNTQWKQWTEDIRALDARIIRKETLEAPDPALPNIEEVRTFEGPTFTPPAGGSDGQGDGGASVDNSPELRFLQFHNWLLTGEDFQGRRVKGYRVRSPIQSKGDASIRKSLQDLAADGNEIAQRFFEVENARIRTQLAGTAAAGGTTIPDEAMRPLVESLRRFNGVLGAGVTVINSLTGADLPIPMDNDTNMKSRIYAESAEVMFPTVPTGQKVLKAHKHGAGIKYTIEFAQDTSLELTSWVMRKLGNQFGRGQGENMTVGDGSNKEWGIVTRAPRAGAKLANSVTAPAFSHFMQVRKAVDAAYQGEARYMFNQNTEIDLLSVTDANNRPMWTPSTAPALPANIAGKPYTVNDFMDDYGAGNTPMIYGWMGAFAVRFAGDITFYNMNEKFIDSGELAVVAWSRSDSDLIDAGTVPPGTASTINTGKAATHPIVSLQIAT